MARRTETVAIDGTQFQVTQLGTVRGKGIWDRLARAIGGSLGQVAASVGTGSVEQQAIAAIRVMAEVPQELLDDLDDAFAQHCKAQINGTFVELGSARVENGVFDQVFAGSYDKLLEWRVACLRVNFAGFLAKLAASAAKRKAEATPSP